MLFGDLGQSLVAEQADHLILFGQPGTDDTRGNHPGIAEDRGAVPQGIAARFHDSGGELDEFGKFRIGGGVDHPGDDSHHIVGEFRQVGFLADDPERLLVDFPGVDEVLVFHGHCGLSFRLLNGV